MKLLQEICSLPTAPFVEDAVIQYVRRFVEARPKLTISRDQSGNLLVELPSRRRLPRWVFTAHMDHPGFIARRIIDKRTLEADFRGYVLADYVRGTRVRFFSNGREVRGRVESVTPGKDRPIPSKVIVRIESSVEANSPGMFDQGAGRVRGTKFYSRAIDDLGGVAGALAMLDELARKPPALPVAVLLTRAEEEGFIGAISASLRPRLLRRTDRIIAIECSAMQPYAPQGKGVIIRVGDRTSIFNSALTYFLTSEAQDLAKRDKTFKFQRALMPGGTCEATVFDLYGFTASSICVPLGNYHNMDTKNRRIGPEYIDVDDWRNMVKLFVQIARNGHRFDPQNKPLKQRIEKRYQLLKRLLSLESSKL